ncbi:hypothetical protein PBRA_000380 [Plasmodiophora brassicae]|nr:hypothetical protein PBRA_000380 [Plasmodiophora brassicae]
MIRVRRRLWNAGAGPRWQSTKAPTARDLKRTAYRMKRDAVERWDNRFDDLEKIRKQNPSRPLHEAKRGDTLLVVLAKRAEVLSAARYIEDMEKIFLTSEEIDDMSTYHPKTGHVGRPTRQDKFKAIVAKRHSDQNINRFVWLMVEAGVEERHIPSEICRLHKRDPWDLRGLPGFLCEEDRTPRVVLPDDDPDVHVIRALLLSIGYDVQIVNVADKLGENGPNWIACR